MGLFSCLLVLGCWELEWCIKQYLLVHRSSIHLETLFFERFLKTWQSSRITLSRHSSCISLPGQCLPFIFPTTTSLCGAQGRIRTEYTCILFIVNSKRGSIEKQVMQSRSKGASVWIDGWIWLTPWGNGFSLSNHPCLSLSFLRHGYPFFSPFFWIMLLWHAIFSLLFRATIIWLYFISGMFYERDHQDMEHL